MRVFALFIMLVLLEISLFVTVGGRIGLWPTLAVVLGSGMGGVALLRARGSLMALDLRSAMDRMTSPLSPMAHHLLIVLAAVLLILPGFATDAMGLLLLLPPVRRGLIAALARRVRVHEGAATHDRSRPDVVIDGEFIELDAPRVPRNGPSGWTRH